ncbi:MAG: permease, partial [Gemmatimonadetes bacterium]|nr:permease [Gemmatimonadota bacterium]
MSNLIRRLRLFLNRDSATRDMQEEMRMHVELRAEQLQTAGNTNASGDAHRMFGNRTQKAEEARSASGLGWLEHVMLDVRYAARRIKQKPAFAAAVICVMSLGIGATTAMFSAVDAAMLRPLPFAKPSELVWLRSIAVPFDPGSGVHEGPFHRLSVLDVDAMKDLFVQSASYAAGGLNVSDEDHPVRANAGVVTAGFFATLGVYPAQGRMFAPEEGKPGAAPVVIVSHKFWQQHLGERNITGATLSLNGTRYQVVGVMPRGFGFPRESDLWIPMSVPTTFATYGAFRGFLNSETIARLAANVSPGKAEAQMMARWQQSLMPGVTKNDPNVT